MEDLYLVSHAQWIPSTTERQTGIRAPLSCEERASLPAGALITPQRAAKDDEVHKRIAFSSLLSLLFDPFPKPNAICGDCGLQSSPAASFAVVVAVSPGSKASFDTRVSLKMARTRCIPSSRHFKATTEQILDLLFEELLPKQPGTNDSFRFANNEG